ncbi:GNAT family N-acetyltransferase, partial [Peribacillus sp. NPDC060186]
MDIKIDDLTGSEVAELVGEHLNSMVLHSPPESIHALNLEELKKPEITFWSVWERDELVGCGALKELDGQHGEIKS